MQGITLCRAGGESTHVFALTCRHVCYGEGETGSRLLGEETLPSKSVIQLPEKTQEKLVAGLETFQQKAAQAIQAEKMKGEACDKVKSCQKIAELQGDRVAVDVVLSHFYCHTTLKRQDLWQRRI
ncbi:hypothetical protein CSPAE12_05058 [Colletotrichum incanum]|nr:hypothetical protein CSPAE12_05058 [Colletotrichum incanum]